MLSGKRQINRMIFPLEKVSWIFSNYFLINSLLLRIMCLRERNRDQRAVQPLELHGFPPEGNCLSDFLGLYLKNW